MKQTTHQRLRRTVWSYYRQHGRHDLPWRRTRDPYKILVSEVMLQQTQVPRVIPKYREFMRTFPTIRALAEAHLRDVLVVWQGLGYNRRAKALHDAARLVVETHGGKVPRSHRELVALPGIGPYTAGAVLVFAFDEPTPLIETNVRTVLLHHFSFPESRVGDQVFVEHARVLMDADRPREWHWALMDYGAHLKARGVRLNGRAKAYVRQTRFKGSDREVRGALLRVLTKGGAQSERTLAKRTGMPLARVCTQLENLSRDGLVARRERRWSV